MQDNVSVCAIVKNSEDVIHTFMNWALDNFPEINVVVDTHNDDETMGEILHYAKAGYQRVTIKMVPFDNFSAQWNRAIEMTTKDFCIYMGADEIIEDIPDNAIEKFMNMSHADVGAFKRFNLQNDDEHHNSLGYPDTQLRVIRMASGIKMDGKVVDETLGVSQDTKINVFPWHIIHYGHVRPESALRLKGKDRLKFADDDACDGEMLKKHGEDWFIKRNEEWNKPYVLRSLPILTVKQSRKYWTQK